MPLKHTGMHDKCSPGKMGDMSPGNSINVYLESDLLIFKRAYTFFFFFKITSPCRGELQWRIPVIHSLSNLAVPEPGPY